MAWDFCKLKSAGLHLHIRKKKTDWAVCRRVIPKKKKTEKL
jgi:hypothetical protein